MTETIIKPEYVTVIIPECCRKGLETCTHVTQKPKKKKLNVGM